MVGAAPDGNGARGFPCGGIKRAVSLAVFLTVIAVLCGGCRARGGQGNSLPPNAGCYVCHMTFIDETLTKVHLAAEIKCTDCHGLSAPHANDEDIGATPPDIVFARDEINPHCRSCHETHDAPPERVIAMWQERVKSEPSSATISPSPICTDCHGEHKIADGA